MVINIALSKAVTYPPVIADAERHRQEIEDAYTEAVIALDTAERAVTEATATDRAQMAHAASEGTKPSPRQLPAALDQVEYARARQQQAAAALADANFAFDRLLTAHADDLLLPTWEALQTAMTAYDEAQAKIRELQQQAYDDLADAVHGVRLLRNRNGIFDNFDAVFAFDRPPVKTAAEQTNAHRLLRKILEIKGIQP